MSKEFDMSKSPAVLRKEPPSEEFMTALESTYRHGTIRGYCELCGRTTFNSSDAGCFEDGELAELFRLAKKHPGWYINVDYTVTIGDIDGQEVVIGCPCNGLRRYENFVWNERYWIAKYFKNRMIKAAEDAKDTAEVAKEASEVEG